MTTKEKCKQGYLEATKKGKLKKTKPKTKYGLPVWMALKHTSNPHSISIMSLLTMDKEQREIYDIIYREAKPYAGKTLRQ